MSNKRGFASRALLSLGLLLGFYSLVFVVFALTLVLVVLQLREKHIFEVPMILACLACMTVWRGVFGVRETAFVAPGPELFAADHPELFAMLARVAKSAGTTVPDHVYLEQGTTAAVTTVGGFAGFGAKRVLILGVGLVSILQLEELEAIIAHEFGHYVGGDLHIEAFLYKARARLIRTVVGLDQEFRRGMMRAVRAPFVAYIELFLKVSQSMSREQELGADRLAASVVGPRIMGEALRSAHTAAHLFRGFLNDDVSTLADEGFIPRDLYRAFDVYAAKNRKAIAPEVERTLREMKTDPYDSHPTHGDRLAHLATLPALEPALDARPARALFPTLDSLGEALAVELSAQTKASVTSTYPEAAREAYVRAIKRDADQVWIRWQQLGFEGSTYLELARKVTAAVEGDPIRWVVGFMPGVVTVPDDFREREKVRPFAERFLMLQAETLFASELLARGGELTRLPASPCTVTLGGLRLTPFETRERDLNTSAALASLRAQLKQLEELPAVGPDPAT